MSTSFGIESLKKLTAPLARKIELMLSRCNLKLVNNSTKTMSAQAEFLEDEIHDECEIWQQFGFTSVPPVDSEGVALFIGGERQTPLIIATENKDKRYQGLKSGECALYSECGDLLALRADNSVELKTKNLQVKSEDKVMINSKKISIKNDQAELIEVLSTLCDVLSKDTVNTSLGPQPLLGAVKYAILKQKIDSFQG